jgi:hypothetical protein
MTPRAPRLTKRSAGTASSARSSSKVRGTFSAAIACKPNPSITHYVLCCITPWEMHVCCYPSSSCSSKNGSRACEKSLRTRYACGASLLEYAYQSFTSLQKHNTTRNGLYALPPLLVLPSISSGPPLLSLLLSLIISYHLLLALVSSGPPLY